MQKKEAIQPRDSSGLTHICIVEDDHIYQFVLKKLFISALPNCRLSFFANGEAAFAFLAAQEALPQLLLVDLNMPIWDGWKLIEEIYNRLPEVGAKTKIYISSSSIDPEDQKRADAHPFITDYLIKPLNKHRLHQIIDSLS